MSDCITCYSNESNPGWKPILRTEYDIVVNIYFINSNETSKDLAQMVERSLSHVRGQGIDALLLQFLFPDFI